MQLSACGTPTPFGATHVGRGFTDPSGDSYYGSIAWCGDYLWLDNDEGVALIDPANNERLLAVRRDDIEDSGWAGHLMQCVGHGRDAVFWLDRFPGGIAWRHATGDDGGTIDDMARNEVWGAPLLLIDNDKIMTVAETGKEVHADRLPAGMSLMSLDQGMIQRQLPDASEIFSLDRIGAGTALVTFRNNVDSYEGAFLALNVDPMTMTATIRASRLTRDRGIAPWDFFNAAPNLDSQGRARLRIIVGGVAQQCVLAEPLAAGPPVVCSKDTEVDLREAMSRALPLAQEILLSPSDRWVVWAESAAGEDGLDGAVEIYLAPVAQVLPK